MQSWGGEDGGASRGQSCYSLDSQGGHSVLGLEL